MGLAISNEHVEDAFLLPTHMLSLCEYHYLLRFGAVSDFSFKAVSACKVLLSESRRSTFLKR